MKNMKRSPANKKKQSKLKKTPNKFVGNSQIILPVICLVAFFAAVVAVFVIGGKLFGDVPSQSKFDKAGQGIIEQKIPRARADVGKALNALALKPELVPKTEVIGCYPDLQYGGFVIDRTDKVCELRQTKAVGITGDLKNAYQDMNSLLKKQGLESASSGSPDIKSLSCFSGIGEPIPPMIDSSARVSSLFQYKGVQYFIISRHHILSKYNPCQEIDNLNSEQYWYNLNPLRDSPKPVMYKNQAVPIQTIRDKMTGEQYSGVLVIAVSEPFYTLTVQHN